MFNLTRKTIPIQADHVADGLSRSSKSGQAILVSGDRITAVWAKPATQNQISLKTEVVHLGLTISVTGPNVG